MKILTIALHSFKELIRKKDVYVLLLLFAGMFGFFYNESFLGVQDISRYLKDIGFSLILLFSMIIAVSFAAKQIPAEIESKTVYSLLAKPISRTDFVLGKYTGSLLMAAGTFTMFYGIYLIGIITHGEGAKTVILLQSYLFSVLLLALLTAITTFFSLFLTVSANITLTFLSYFLIRWVNTVIHESIVHASEKFSFFSTVIYYLLPHFEFYDMKMRLVHMWDPLPGWVVVSVAAYTMLYIVLILCITCNLFIRKSI